LGHEGPQWNEEKRPDDNEWGGASVTAFGGWPNYNIPQSYPIHWSIRRWTSEVSGDIIVSGIVAEWGSISHGEGANTIIYVDGISVWSHYIPPTPGYDHAYEIKVSGISIGSVIDFAIDPRDNSWYDGTIFTCQIIYQPTPIEVTVNIDPDTLNLNSKGKWITCYIELPEGYDVEDIYVSTIKLDDQVPAELHPTEIGDEDDDGVPDLMVKFDRSAVQQILQVGDNVEITVAGELQDDSPFKGSDTIRVIDKGGKK